MTRKTMSRRFLILGWIVLATAWMVLGATLLLTPSSQAGGEKSAYVILSGEFFEAMQKLSGSNVTYGDKTEPLLQQIALANQYVVKTNLTLIRQNEKIIQLLEEINRKRPAQDR
ncbi:MAG: hypothetical protein FJ128_13995 [Deltaproteobacteria bacterium]|nr:hypothetical protein [Deltaproteobacteria bacterium]